MQTGISNASISLEDCVPHNLLLTSIWKLKCSLKKTGGGIFLLCMFEKFKFACKSFTINEGSSTVVISFLVFYLLFCLFFFNLDNEVHGYMWLCLDHCHSWTDYSKKASWRVLHPTCTSQCLYTGSSRNSLQLAWTIFLYFPNPIVVIVTKEEWGRCMNEEKHEGKRYSYERYNTNIES